MINSITGNLWQLNTHIYRDFLTIKQNFDLPDIVAQILANKNILVENIEYFLKPSLKMLLPEPYHLHDMQKAVERIIDSLRLKEKIVIFGDYDVDGATSSALIKRYFNHIGIDSTIYIPDRINEGYGPNLMAFKKFKKEGINLCITVDCGTVAHEPIKGAKNCGLDVIIIDHHVSMNNLPEALAIINPNRIDQDSNCSDLAAVGVSFLFLVALNRALKNIKYFNNNNICEPNLLQYLDLVALGTVCDVVKLVGLNRAFVFQGLKIFSQRTNIGLKILSDVLQINTPINTYHLGFMIGPSINAGGRIGSSNLGAKLLSTNCELEAHDIANTLKILNEERKELEKNTLDDALSMCNTIKEKFGEKSKNFIMVHNNWHPGVIGIVASRLKDKFNLPSFVISIKDKIGKASARSIDGINIGSIILSSKLEGLIIEGGGHAMAGGFSIFEDKISELYDFFSKTFVNINTTKIIKFDSYFTINSINDVLLNHLSMLEPFGSGNKEPLFVIKDIFFTKINIIKNDHIICNVCDKHTKKGIKGVIFKAFSNKIAENILSNKVKMILCKIKKNTFADKIIPEIIIEDIA